MIYNVHKKASLPFYGIEKEGNRKERKRVTERESDRENEMKRKIRKEN